MWYHKGIEYAENTSLNIFFYGMHLAGESKAQRSARPSVSFWNLRLHFSHSYCRCITISSQDILCSFVISYFKLKRCLECVYWLISLASYIADAISANTGLEATHFEDFHKYRIEWIPGPQGYIEWWARFRSSLTCPYLGHFLGTWTTSFCTLLKLRR